MGISDSGSPPFAGDVEPFPTMSALRTANLDLAEQRRHMGDSLELLEGIAVFLRRASATGVLLDDGEERWNAQGLLDYWGTVLNRAGLPMPEATLAEFDPLLAPELPENACPYLGLDAFDEVNTGLFFGRQRVVTELVERLRDHRLLAVVGPSGSGKSSLVRAGLQPALRADGVSGSAGWQILAPMVPGSDPSAALDRVLTADDGAGVPRLLLIDQFEETFTLCTDETSRKGFLSRLVAMATDVGVPHRVVLTMRSDFEPFIARAEVLQPLYETGKVTLPALTAGELRETIERPAEQVGLKFEAGVVDALLGDILGEPAALPLLQYSLLKLWEARERNRVTLAAYKQVGGGRLALARGADAAYTKLIPEEQVTAKRILLRLVRPGEGLEITSNRVRRRELDRGGEDPGRVARVLEKLVSARLLRLTPGDSPEDTQVEVAHEALVRNWPTLVEWLEDERHFLRQRQRLNTAAEQWERLGRDPGALWRGIQLAEVTRYDDLNFIEREFIDTSVNEQERIEREREATIRRLEQLTTELEQQRRLVDIQRLAFAAQSLAGENPELAVLLSYEAAATDDSPVTQQALREALLESHRVPLTLRGHAAPLSVGQFSPDGTLVVTGAQDGSLRLWSRDGYAIVALDGHTDSITSLAFSPDGAYLLSGASDATVQIWDVASYSTIAVLSGHAAPITCVTYNPEGTLIASASGDSTIRLWRADGELIHTFSESGTWVRDMAFSPDGRLLATGSHYGAIMLYTSEGTLIRALGRHVGGIIHVRFSPDGQMVLSCGWDDVARIHSVDGDQLEPIARLTGHAGPIMSAEFSPDGKMITTASWDSTARIWDLTGRLLAVLNGQPGQLKNAAFSADGQRVVTSSSEGTAWVWDLSGRKLDVLSGHTDELEFARFSPHSDQILTLSTDGTARIWSDVTPLLPLRAAFQQAIAAVAISPDGTKIITSWMKRGRVHLWRPGQPLLESRGDRSFSFVSFSPDGSLIALTGNHYRCRVLSSDSFKLVALLHHDEPTQVAAFTPDSRQIVTGDYLGGLAIWDISGQCVTQFRAHTNRINGLAVAPDGRLIATGSTDKMLRIWNTSGQQQAVMEGHTNWITSVAFSPDGTHLVTGSADKTVRIWCLADHSSRVLLGHTGWVETVAVDAQGRMIASGSRDGTIRFWDWEGNSLVVLRSHMGSVRSILFTPEGRRLIAIGYDGTVREYAIYTNDLLPIAACRVGRGLTDEEIARFNVPTPLKFNFAKRQCPPVYSWEVGK